MGEEWRLLIGFDADGALERAAAEIAAALEEEVELHKDDDGLVAYAGTLQAARAAEDRLRSELEKYGLEHLEPHIDHWSHEDQEWQDATGSPTEPEDDEDEDENETDDEPADTGPRTVAVSLSHHHEAKQLADQLRSEGWDASSSWHTVEITTRSRDDAESLVAELEARAPDAAVAISA